MPISSDNERRLEAKVAAQHAEIMRLTRAVMRADLFAKYLVDIDKNAPECARQWALEWRAVYADIIGP